MKGIGEKYAFTRCLTVLELYEVSQSQSLLWRRLCLPSIAY